MRHALAYVAGFGAVFTLLGVTATFAAGPLVEYLPALRMVGGVVLIVMGLSLAGILRIPVLERNWRPLDAGASGSLATATGIVQLRWFGNGRHDHRRRPPRRAPRQLARRLARVVRPRGDLRDRLDAVHRDHPRRHPDDGRDRPAPSSRARHCWSPTRSVSVCRSCSSRPSTIALRG